MVAVVDPERDWPSNTFVVWMFDYVNGGNSMHSNYLQFFGPAILMKHLKTSTSSEFIYLLIYLFFIF